MAETLLQAGRLQPLAGFVLLLLIPGITAAEDRAKTTSAVTRSLELLQQTAATYTDQRDCFSCHHQALPSMAISLAAMRGFEVNRPQVVWQSEFTAAFFLDRSEKLEKGGGVPGGPYTAAYAAVQLAADGAEQPRAAKLLVQYLQQTRQDEGYWKMNTKRPPLEISDFTSTALSLAALRLHDRLSDPGTLELTIGRAVDWLAGEKPQTTEDRVYQLLGIYWGSVDLRRGAATSWSRLFHPRAGTAMDVEVKKSFQQTVARLRELQQDDGGWAQLDSGTSDAYASGQVVATLLATGAARPADDSIRRGIRYLLQTQQDDGSWHVVSRSKAFQEYFESGFPHGPDQFISTAASSWATMALVLSLPARPSRSARGRHVSP